MSDLPFKGMCVVLTRSAEGSEQWKKELTELGARVYYLPTIEMRPVKMTYDLERTLRDLREVDWLIFTSATGVKYFKEKAEEIELDITGRDVPPVAVVGQATAEAAEKAGMDVRFIPSSENSDTLARELEPVQGKRIVLLRTTIASDELPKKLKQRGGIVNDVKIYTTAPRNDPEPEFEKLLQENVISYLIFASPSAVKGFCGRVSAETLPQAKKLPAVALGPTVTDALRASGFNDILTAERPSVAGVIMTILKHPRYPR